MVVTCFDQDIMVDLTTRIEPFNVMKEQAAHRNWNYLIATGLWTWILEEELYAPILPQFWDQRSLNALNFGWN